MRESSGGAARLNRNRAMSEENERDEGDEAEPSRSTSPLSMRCSG